MEVIFHSEFIYFMLSLLLKPLIIFMNKTTLLLLSFCVLINLKAQNENKWMNKDYRTIYQFQDTRNSGMLLTYLTHKDAVCRELAAQAFASIQDSLAVPLLSEMVKNDKNTRVRAEAAYSLGQLRRPWLFNDMVKLYVTEKDETVKAVLLEAIGKCAVAETISFFEKLELPLKQGRPTVIMSLGYTRGVYFASRRGFKSDSLLRRLKILSAESGDTFISYVYNKMNLKKTSGVVKESFRPVMNLRDCRDSLKKISGPYDKVRFMEKYNYGQETYSTLAFSEQDHYTRSYCMEQYFKIKPVNKGMIHKCLQSGDIAFVAMAVERIRTDSLWKNSADAGSGYLEYVRDSLLTMPRDFEVFVEIEKTLAWLSNRTFTYLPPKFNHPIDWDYVQKLKPIEKVRITTGKGEMIMLCNVNEVPASVSNFLKLVDSGYFNGKYFHRMVPEFVVQGGCPRGDGWGALNWTQRSEFNRDFTYRKGSVGLASAGKDSEGVQFFITHGFTPSLDGRYTIFGEISEGLEVIDLLQIGDKILNIERIR